MPDYDLGKAHGEIVIETNDKASKDTNRILNEIQKSVRRLEKQLEATNQILRKHEQQLRSNAKAVKDVGNEFDGAADQVKGFKRETKDSEKEANLLKKAFLALGDATKNVSTGIAKVTKNTASVERITRLMGTSMKDVEKKMLQAAGAAMVYHQAITRLHHVVYSFGSKAFISKKLGLDEGLKLLPKFVTSIFRATTALTGFNSAVKHSLKQGFVSKIFAVAAGSSFVAALTKNSNAVRSYVAVVRNRLADLANGGNVHAKRMTKIFDEMAAKMTGAAHKVGAIGRQGKELGGVYTQAIRLARGMSFLTAGLGITANAVKGFVKMANLMALALTAVSGGMLVFKALGSAVLGAAGAIKQLSGAVVLLPGILVALGVAGSIAFVAIKGVKEAFTAAGKEGEDFDEAIKDLSPVMKEVAIGAQGFRKELKGLRDIASDNMFRGFGKEVEALGRAYMPILEKGVSRVSSALKVAKDGFVTFLANPETVKGTNEIFGLTEKVLRNIFIATRPVLDAFRDLAIVGLEAGESLTNSWGASAEKFAAFIAVSKNNGSIRRWIDDGIQGFKDLGVTIANLGRMVATVFGAFGSTGENALSRMRSATEGWVSSLKNSTKEGGAFAAVIEHMGRTGSMVLEGLRRALEAVADSLKSSGSFMDTFSNAFAGGLLDSIDTVVYSLKGLVIALNLIPSPLVELAGSIIAFATLNKIITLILSPMKRMALLAIGLTSTIFGAVKSIRALIATLAVAKSYGLAMSVVMHKMKLDAVTMAGVMAGVVVASIAAAIAIWAVWASRRQQAKDSENAYTKAVSQTAKAHAELNRELQKTGGELTSGVYEKMGSGLEKLTAQMEAAGEKKAGLFQGDWFPGQHSTADKIQETASLMKAAKQNVDDLGLSSEDLAKKITGSSASFELLRQRLINMGKGGETAANFLEEERNQILGMVAAAEKIGPANGLIAEGIKQIGAEGATTSDKLDGLRMALQGLGLIQSSAEQAAFDYAKTIRELGDKISDLADEEQALGENMLDGAGKLDPFSKNAQILNDELQSLGQQFQAAAVAGEDPWMLFDKLQPTLQSLADEFQISKDKVIEFARAAGVLPKEISILLEVAGSDKATQDVAAVVEAAQAANGKQFSIGVDPASLAGIQALGATLVSFDEEHEMGTFTWDPASAAKALESLQSYIKGSKVELPVNPVVDPNAKKDVADGVTPDKPVEIPVTPVLDGKEVDSSGTPSTKVNTGTPSTHVNVGGSSGSKPKEEEPQPAKAPEPAKAPAPAPAPAAKAPEPARAAEPAKAPEVPKTVTTTIKVNNAGDALSAIKGVVDNLALIKDKTATLMVKNADVAFGAVQGVLNALSQMKDKTVSLSVKNADVAWGAVQGVLNGLSQLKSNYTARLSVENADVAFGAIQGVVNVLSDLVAKIDDTKGKFSELATTIETVMARIIAAVNGAMTTVATSLSNAAVNAKASGESLGQGFADGILSKTEAARQAALKLAQAASGPLPNSPAKEGPFSGKGWTPYRGEALAVGFADGIASGTSGARSVSLDLAEAVSSALESARAAVGLQITNFAANRKPGAGGKKYYRDPDVSASDLAETRKKNTEQAVQSAKDDAFREKKQAAQDAARDADRAKEKGSDDSSTDGDDSKIDNFVRGLDDAQYGMGEFSAAALDCSAFVSAVANTATGRAPFSERGSTTNMREFLTARGFEEGAGGKGDLSVGWWDNGGGENGHAALTTGSGLNAESTTGGVRFGDEAAGARSNNAQFTNFMHLPGKTLKGIEENTGTVAGLADDSAKSYDKTSAEELQDLRAQNKKLDEAIKVTGDPNATDPEIIRALQDLDDEIAVTEDPDIRSEMESIRSQTMENRGMKEYDPNENASTDPVSDVTGIAQNVLGIYSAVEQGIQGFKSMVDLLARGFENTSDITTFVDGIQGLVSSVTGIVDTAAGIADTVASLAALAGAAIPGVGQVTSAISAVTGGIGQVNAIVDLVQEAGHIIGRWVGTGLSALAGGLGGPLQGDVKMLLDTNDQTLKRWSSDNAMDKRSTNLDPFNLFANKDTNGGAANQFNIYANPNAPASEIINEAMYAVRTSSAGAYQE